MEKNMVSFIFEFPDQARSFGPPIDLPTQHLQCSLWNHPAVWVNYNISLTWILRPPTEDDFPNPNHDFQGSVAFREVVRIYPDDGHIPIVVGL